MVDAGASEGFTELFEDSIPNAAETELTAENKAQRNRPWFVQGVAVLGSNLQRVRLTVPGTWHAQSVHVIPDQLAANGFRRQEFPVQMPVPANRDLDVFAFQDSGIAETNFAVVFGTFKPMPNKPTGLMYSLRHTLTAGNLSPNDGTDQEIPALGASGHRLIGQLAHGAGSLLLTYGIRNERIGLGEFQGLNQPIVNGLPDVATDRDGKLFFEPQGGPFVLDERDQYTPAAMDQSGGGVTAYDYWFAEGLKVL